MGSMIYTTPSIVKFGVEIVPEKMTLCARSGMGMCKNTSW